MSIPYDLTIAYKTINSLKLTDLNNSSLKMFVSLLNASIPDNTASMHFSAYMLVRGMFRANPDAYKSYIDSTPEYAPLVLWTDYSNILIHFKIQENVYLGWDSKKNRYCAHFFTKPKSEKPILDNPFAKSPASESKLTSDFNFECKTQSTNEEMYKKFSFGNKLSKVSDLDNNDVYANMMQRISKINPNNTEKK
jgi:hypothetical protein